MLRKLRFIEITKIIPQWDFLTKVALNRVLVIKEIRQCLLFHNPFGVESIHLFSIFYHVSRCQCPKMPVCIALCYVDFKITLSATLTTVGSSQTVTKPQRSSTLHFGQLLSLAALTKPSVLIAQVLVDRQQGAHVPWLIKCKLDHFLSLND